MNRRSFLRAAGAAPLAARAAAESAVAHPPLSGVRALSANAVGYDSVVGATDKDNRLAFTDFAEFFREANREEELRRMSKRVNALDPDILVLGSLPISTKIRMQQERNYRDLVEAERASFFRQLGRNGKVFWRL